MPPTIQDEFASPVSWGAILVGAFAAAALTLIFIAIGAATGLSLVSPWTGASVSATTFKLTTGAYVVLTAIIASAVGGYTAGRLRGRWTTTDDETTFRDTAHGMATWAVATVMGVAVIGAGSAWIVGNVAGGTAQGAAAQSASQAAPTDYYVDMLLRPAPSAAAPTGTASPLGAPAQPASSDAAATRREVGLIFTRGFASGAEFPAADRTYLAQLVSSRTGLNQQDAQARVNDTLTKTKEYLDAARKNAIATALWIVVALFAGAFAASAAAIEGGQLRDGRWSGVIFNNRNTVRRVR
jgi:hypothetical protein